MFQQKYFPRVSLGHTNVQLTFLQTAGEAFAKSEVLFSVTVCFFYCSSTVLVVLSVYHVTMGLPSVQRT